MSGDPIAPEARLEPPRGRSLLAAPVSWAMGAAAFLLFLLPGLLGSYGAFIDELYYVSCAERPAWGYVDHPPGAPLVLHLSRAILGDGLVALRLPAALLGAALVLGVGLLARRLGARRGGELIACLAAIGAPIHLILFGSFSMNPFEIVFWLAFAWILIEIEMRHAPRLWLLFGALAGLALLFKHTTAIYAAGLALGLLVTPARRHLADRRLWFAALIALVMLAPNLGWQVAHGWPSLEFYRNADLEKNVATPPHVGLLLQILVAGPGALPVWIAGIVFFLRRRRDVDLRHLGWLSIALLVLMLASQKSRPDRIAGMYPALFAAGGAMIDRWARGRGRWLSIAVPAWLVISAIPFAPLGIPFLPPAALAGYAARTGLVPQIEAGAGKRAELPQWFADRLGWEELVDDVAAARDRLSAEDREDVVYFVPSYGHAGALERLGRDRGLNPVYCTQNSWHLWGPPAKPVEVAIVVGDGPDHLGELFEEVELAGLYDCDYVMPWRNHSPIWIVRRELGPIAAHWEGWKHYE